MDDSRRRLFSFIDQSNFGFTRCSDTGSKVVRARERSIQLSRVCRDALKAARNVSTFPATF